MSELSSIDSAVSGRDFLNELQEGIWIADNHGHIAFANRALARMLGYESPDILHGKAWRELFPAAEVTRLSRVKPGAIAAAFSNSSLITPTSQHIPVNVTILRRTAGKNPVLVGSVVPAASVRVPGAVPDSTSRQVMENSIDGICIVEGSRTTYANRRFEELTGYTASQVTHLGLDRLISLRDRRVVSQVFADPDKVLAPVHYDIRLVHRSGHEIDCELRLVPVAAGDHAALLCFMRDVSELKQAERARTDFIAMLSHDLRTPLAAIKEAMSLLSETGAARLEDRQRRYLTIAREEIDRLNRMIENLIEASRMEAGKVVLRLDAVDLAELLSTAIESMSLLINKRNLTIERNIPARLPPIQGDRDRLLRVLNNLLDNAIKYSPVSGTIKIDIRFVDPGAPVLSGNGMLPNTGYVQVMVTDSGPGIPAEFLDRIFGKFERVDPYGPGIGLGLAIVKSIAELHHGKVWAMSNLGEGASFTFILPIKENL